MNSNLFNFVIALLFASFSTLTFSQDIVYANRYPNGLVVDSVIFKGGKCKFSPINNKDLKIVLQKSEIYYITRNDIKIYDNTKNSNFNYYRTQWENGFVTLKTDSLTGEIQYINIIEFEGKSRKELFDLFKHLPKNQIDFELVAEDNIDYTYQKYVGKFRAHNMHIYVTLLAEFKDGRLRYKLFNFLSSKEAIETKSFMTTSISSKSITKEYSKYFEITKLYAQSDWFKDVNRYWRVIETNVNATISNIEKLAVKQEDW